MRFLDVGDRNKPDLETLLGLLELARDCVAIGMNRQQAVLGAEHIEISVGDTDDQVLLCRLAIGLGPGHDLVRLSQPHDLVPAKQRLPQAEAPARRFIVDFGLERERHHDEISRVLRLLHHRVLDART